MTLNQAILSETTLSVDTASVVIPVPSGYTDLRLVVSARSTATASGNPDDGGFMQINSVTSGYATKDLYGNGGGAASSTNPYGVTSKIFIGAVSSASATAGTFASKEIYIPNYASSAAKSINIDSAHEHNGSTAYTELLASALTVGAITSLTLTLNAGSYVAGSSFTLYGISKLGVTPTLTPKATGGDIIKNDGTYWYHAFLSTGQFIPQTTLSCQVLQVAGGGGSANDVSGGGGAGGVTYASAISATGNTTYAITVGAGGVGAVNPGGSGGNSTAFGITALGGGGSSAYATTAPSGGSGGGGSHRYSAGGSATQTSGANYTGYGNAGGAAVNSGSTQGGGGGGGAGGAGADSTGNPGNGGNGGAPITTFSAWASATGTGVSGNYAGGGGGSSQYSSAGTASGGGAAGTTSGNGNPGTANTGGGAGGARDNGANGGSGIVIIRYAMA